MPKLPEVQDLGPRPTPQSNGGIVSVRPIGAGEAEANMGAALNTAGQILEREQNRLDTLRAEDAYNRLQDRAQDLELGEKNGFRNIKGGEVVNKPIREDYEKRFSDAVSEIESSLGDGRQRELFRRRAALSANQFRARLFNHYEGESSAYAKQVAAGGIDRELRNISKSYDRPMDVGASTIRAFNLIDQEGDRTGEPQDQRDKKKATFNDMAWESRLAAWRMQDPAGALQAFHENANEISNPKLRQQLGESLFRDAAPVLAAQLIQNPELITIARSDAEALAIAQLGDAAGKKVSVKVDPKAKGDTLFDMLPSDQKMRLLDAAKTQAQQGMAQFREAVGFRVQDANEALERGQAPADVPTTAELTTAYGPERGVRVAGQLEAARRFGNNVSRVAAMSTIEQRDLLESERPQPGPGYATNIARHEELVRAVTQVNAERAKDPAAYALTYAPSVSAAYQSMNSAPNDPAAAQAYAQATVAEQKRLGIAEPKLLPKPMADAIARQFNDLSDGAQKPAQLIQQYSATWGRHWPQVYQQISKEVGPTTRVVANLRDTPAAALLSMNAKMKTSELRSPIPTADAETVDKSVEIELTPFRQSLVGWTTSGSETYGDFDQAAKRNAYVYTAQGMKPGPAAKRAASELVSEYYNFVGPTRIPTSVNVRVAEAGMSSVLRDAENLSVRIPDGEARVLGKDFTAKQLATSLKDKGFFVTLGDDSGVALYMQGQNGERAVEGADGRPITFTWKQLTDRAAKAAAKAPLRIEENEGGAATGRARQKSKGDD